MCIACILKFVWHDTHTCGAPALAGSTPRLVELSARKVLGAVDVRAVVQTTPAALCIRFGCEAIAELVTRVYAEYQVPDVLK